MRRWLLAAAIVTVAVAPPVAATAQDTAAVAINTRDDSTLFRFAFAVRRVTGDVVDQSNAAVAFASCTDCQTAAIAIQVLLIMSDPSIVVPQNIAIALNSGCTGCETLASAYQFVFGAGTTVRFTAEGNQAIADLRSQLQQLRNDDLTNEELFAEVEAIVAQLEEVLATELVPVGQPQPEPTPSTSASTTPSAEATETESDEVTEPVTTPTATSSSTPTTTPSTAPSATTTPSSDPTASASSSPSPTATASGSASPTPTTTTSPTAEPTPSPSGS